MIFFRDPNSLETLKVFHECIKWAYEGSFSEKDIEEAKLAVFSQVKCSAYSLF